MIEIRTPRLRLVAATLEMAQADPAMLSQLLGADLPREWPPPLNDDDSARFFADYMKANPDSAGWIMWYFVREKGRPIAIGNGGFKGKPIDGCVEVGYSIVSEFQRLGYATEAVSALIAWAFEHAEVRRVIAETLPELAASQALLRKLGFDRIAGASEPGLLRFERRRSANSGIS